MAARRFGVADGSDVEMSRIGEGYCRDRESSMNRAVAIATATSLSSESNSEPSNTAMSPSNERRGVLAPPVLHELAGERLGERLHHIRVRRRHSRSY
jgi:hypothetical protein